MAIRLMECHRVLKNSGSIYLHCDPTMSHYLKLLMDNIFGENNFKDEIVWNVGSVSGYKSQKKGWIRQHDILLYYLKSKSFVFNKQYLPYKKEYVDKMFKHTDKDGRRYRLRGEKRYYEDEKGTPLGTNWTDIYSLQTITQSGEVTGYPTQKPVALLERIIKASSNEGDLVLDPFCGCATTCVAAEKLNRQWVGIDVSIKAYDLVKERLNKEVADPEDLYKYSKEIFFSTKAPKRTDKDTVEREKKYLYVISNPSYPREYKVGVAKNLKSRLNSYQTSDPDRSYKVEYTLHTPYFRELEKHIHNKFENKHEWVQPNELNDIIKEIEIYQPTDNIDDPKQEKLL